MPDQEITEDQRALGKLYVAHQYISLPYDTACMVCMGIGTFVHIFLPRGFPFWWTVPLVCLSMLIPIGFLVQRKETTWLKSLTEEKKALLERAAHSQKYDRWDRGKPARDILKAYHKLEVNAEKELLRASKPTNDETLLRPTTAYNETQKEELLRASGKDT